MKAGTIFLVTSGEYSDFGILATLRALHDFDFDAEVARAMKSTQDPYDDDGYLGDFTEIISAIESTGLVEHVYLPEMYIGAYGRFEPGAEERSKEVRAEAPLRSWAPCCSRHADCREHPELGVACAIATEASR